MNTEKFKFESPIIKYNNDGGTFTIHLKCSTQMINDLKEFHNISFKKELLKVIEIEYDKFLKGLEDSVL